MTNSRTHNRLFLRSLLLAALCCTPLLCVAEAPTRVKDLRYGDALYHYHQGALFAALTSLEVAKAKGGIQGHGDHPLLVEGGLLLAYGLHREAKARFEQALADQIDASSRNQAWFYLGKVLYLEADHAAAAEALQQVDTAQLQRDDAALFAEWHYLQAQMALREGRQDGVPALPEDAQEGLWWAYTQYNRALREEDAAEALGALEQALAAFLESRPAPALQREAHALRDRTLLSLGQLHLQNSAYQAAFDALKQLRRDSVFAEQGLFQFAVAASHLNRPEQALGALKQLQSRELFTPWLQQVPYALAYLYEQMGEAALAYEAYRAASGHYRTQHLQLGLKKENLSEEQLLAALRFSEGARAGLGSALLDTDAYGRLKVTPEHYDYAALLADERFQIALRDLHELYKLRDSLATWARQLDSFDTMLATRTAQRALKISATQAELERLQVSQWEARQSAYAQAIAEATANEDWQFFMNEDQMDMAETLEAVKANLALLPDTEDYADLKAAFTEKLRRAQGYFDWWLADSFGVNRWAAQKQLKGLNRAMQEFETRNATLQELMRSDDDLRALNARVQSGRARLAQVRIQLDGALQQARQALLSLVEAELDRQQQEAAEYLLASREAQARLADLLLQGRPAAVENKADDPEASTEAAP